MTTYGKLSDAHLTHVLQVPSFATLLWKTYEIWAVNLSDLTFVPIIMNTVQDLKIYMWRHKHRADFIFFIFSDNVKQAKTTFWNYFGSYTVHFVLCSWETNKCINLI
jgi:hypothetical protein